MADTNRNTSTGWGTAKVQLSGELDYDPDAEWTECDPPQSEDNSGLNLNDDEIEKAKEDCEYVNSLLG